ncbi:MAG: hypothetical protein QOG42_159 [Solirubrobacteraceae bacterium]|nr:hypothetical protein [Solirubrobacteraceae bacterium]
MAHRSRFIGAGTLALATGMLIALPTFSSGATVQNDLRSFAPAPQSAQTRVGAADEPSIKPPLHGTNPHAQGTAAVVDLTPNTARPFTVDTKGNASDEDVIVGRSRGELRANGTYHGHITVAALFGNEILGRDTEPGQTINETIPGQSLCPTAGPCLDLGLVEVFSQTTTTGSTNRFSLARAALGLAAGVPALQIGAAQSSADISSDGTCLTSRGASSVADVRAATAIANLAQSTSRSRACSGAQAPSQTNTSSVIALGGTGVPIPTSGCDDGTPDRQADLLVIRLVCNADDSSATTPAGNQAAGTYGVRNALDVYVLAITGGSALAQVSTGQSESLAVAPAAVATTPTPTTTPATTPAATTPLPAAVTTTPAAAATTPAPADTADNAGTADTGADNSGNVGAGDNGGSPQCSDGVDNDGDGKIDFGNDPGCSSASDDSEADNVATFSGKQLPFTGTDVVGLGLAGALLLAAGLALRGPTRRRRVV